MNIDEREWNDQESAFESIRSGKLVGDEPRIKEYRILWRAVARQTIPALSDDFARRVALLADARSDRVRRIERRFEYGLAGAMLATLAVAAGLLSACFGTDWLRPLLATDPWLEAFLVCLAILAGSHGLHRGVLRRVTPRRT
jgi:hypothetical protein